LTPIVGKGGMGMTDQILLARNLRLVRLVRAVRMMELFADLWKLSVGLVRSSRTVASACVLMTLVGYIFGCVGIEWIGKSPSLREDPVTGPIVAMYFGSIGRVLLTLIQFVNADSIGAIYTPLINKDPLLIIFFGGLIVGVTVLLMNLVTACVVESAVKTSTEDAEMARARVTKQIMTMAPKVETAFNALDMTKDGLLEKQELIHLASHMEHLHLPPELARLLQPDKMLDLFDVLDIDQDGKVTAPEFIEGICTLAFSHVPTETMQMLHLLRVQDRKLMALCADVRALSSPLQDARAGSAKDAGRCHDGCLDGARPFWSPGAPIGRHKLPDAPVPTPAL
jgi:Ca2+-binding EF-hand superfamily protein